MGYHSVEEEDEEEKRMGYWYYLDEYKELQEVRTASLKMLHTMWFLLY